jgi:ATP-binding protein involved in chromosome partitioning
MATMTKEAVAQSLRGVIDPASKRDVVSLGLVRGVAVCDGVAKVAYQVPADIASPPLQKALNDQTRSIVSALPGMKSVEIEINVVASRATNALPGVRNVIAVGAGKGGVGKSTVSVLLAVGLQRLGFRTGILDADVYGPSIPKLTGTETAQPMVDSDGRLFPPVRDGMPIMSMGYLVSPDQAVIWRGPMAQKYVKDFIDRGSWGEIDHLIVDLPPGTGDIPLTLAQSIPLTGAVIVCTPQDVALLDAIKALRMYQKLGVEPLGIVENMSYYVCPQCGHREHIFDHGGCEHAAQELGIPFLGHIPLNIAIRRFGDAGTPGEYFTKTEGYVADAIENVVKRLADEIDRRTTQRTPLPQLTVRD